jgi:hypothetical protein
MEIPRLHHQNKTLKLALTAYLFLSILGFSIAGLISHQRYGFDHKQTIEFYLGDESQMAFPKLYSQLITTAHVHSFVMPLVFLILWLGLTLVPLRAGWKGLFILGGTLSILTYNGAPFLVRYHSPQWVWLFTAGGIGLFFFYLVPAGAILYEAWFGFQNSRN